MQSAETRGAEGRSLICIFIGTPLYRPVQKLDPVYREGDGGEILFHFSFQKIGSHLVQHVAEPVMDCRKQDRLMDPGGVLEGDSLYGGALR